MDVDFKHRIMPEVIHIPGLVAGGAMDIHTSSLRNESGHDCLDFLRVESPAHHWQIGNDSPFELLIEFHGSAIIAQVVRDDGQCQLGGPPPAISPLETRQTVVSKIEPWIEWGAVYSDESGMVFSPSFICLHWDLLD